MFNSASAQNIVHRLLPWYALANVGITYLVAELSVQRVPSRLFPEESF
jgi:hypothetical protein